MTTGYESLALPVVECDVTWPQGGAVPFLTRMRLSNRRAQYSGQAFLRPPQTGGMGLGFGFGQGGGMFDAYAAGAAEASLAAGAANAAGYRSGIGDAKVANQFYEDVAGQTGGALQNLASGKAGGGQTAENAADSIGRAGGPT